MHDPIQNPEGELRRAAGGSDTGTSTGGVIIGQYDPLAGLNAVSPGEDLGGGGRDTPTVDVQTLLRGAKQPDVFDMGDGPDLGMVALVVAVAAALWVVLRG